MLGNFVTARHPLMLLAWRSPRPDSLTLAVRNDPASWDYTVRSDVHASGSACVSPAFYFELSMEIIRDAYITTGLIRLDTHKLRLWAA